MELNEIENTHQNATTSMKVVLLIFALVLVGALWYLVYYQNTAVDYTDNGSSTVTPAQSAVEKTYQKTAELAAVGTYTGEGQATARYDAEKGEYTLTVTATLGDPAEGKFYEGWLVRGTSGEAKFKAISTGRLTKNEDGSWGLTFTAPVDYPGFLEVVITEETEANGLDNQPEDHVLEGKFS